MDDDLDPTPPRRARIARSGLLGLAAAGLVGAVALAAGAGILPGGIFAANTATSSTATTAQQGPGDQDGDGFRGGPGGRGGMGIHAPITVTSISGTSVSLGTADGWTRTITVASDTKLAKGTATIALTDLKVGDEVRFSETKKTDGTWHIDELDVVLPHLDGTVKAISGSTITVTLRDGTTGTITVASGATIEVGGTSAKLSDLAVGMVVRAEGASTGTNAITASDLHAFDPATAPAGGRHGMGPMDGWGPGPDASAAPSATG
jgi:hypothetical protein